MEIFFFGGGGRGQGGRGRGEGVRVSDFFTKNPNLKKKICFQGGAVGDGRKGEGGYS